MKHVGDSKWAVTPESRLFFHLMLPWFQRVDTQEADPSSPTSLPNVSVPAVVQRGVRSVIAEWDLQGFWKQSLTAAYFAQSAQALSPKSWREIVTIQGLVDSG